MPVEPSWTIHTASCEQMIQDYPENTFHLSVTSPPYKDKDGYNPILMASVAEKLYKVTKPKGLSFINFASLAEDWGRPFDLYDLFIEAGWLPVTTVAWVKSMVFPSLDELPGSLGEDVAEIINYFKFATEDPENKQIVGYIETLQKLLEPHQVGHYTPIDTEKRMNNLWEYVHVFAKGERPDLDRFTPPLGVPYADKSNLTRGTRGKHGDTHCAGNVWFIPYLTRSGPKSAHPHEYPLDLVQRCITLSKAGPGDLLIDPFCGGGSTLIAAKEMGISGVAYEINPLTADLARKRLETHPLTICDETKQV